MFEGSFKATLSVTEAPVRGDSALIPKRGKGRREDEQTPSQGELALYLCEGRRGGRGLAAQGRHPQGSGFGQSLDSASP